MSSTTATIAAPSRAATVARTVWPVFLLAAGCFYFIEHDWNAQAVFQDLISSPSLEELNTESLFEQRFTRQAACLVLGAIGGLILLFSPGRGRRSLSALGALILFFLAWNALSVFWAADTMLTVRRLIMFGLICVGAAGIQSLLTTRQIMQFALIAPAGFLVIGVLAEIANGTFQPLMGGYRFAGTLHPNAQAINCALMFFAAINFARDVKRDKFFFVLLAVVAFAFLYLTKSRTALAATIIVFGVHWAVRQSRMVQMASACVGVAGVLGLLLLAPILQDTLQRTVALGRADTGESTGTLTGRTELWSQLSGYMGEAPILGYGYGGFWNEERSMDVIEEQGWPISHAHNAYIDIFLDAGPVAVLTYVLLLILAIRLGLRHWQATGDIAYGYLSVLLLFCAINGMLESVAIQRSLITFICMLALVRLAFSAPPAETRPDSLARSA